MGINIRSDINCDKEYKKNVKDIDNKKSNNRLNYHEISELTQCLRQIQVEIPNINIEIKTVAEKDVIAYYEKLMSNPIEESFKSKITLSEKVLEKMNKDKEYALKMIATIVKLSKPKSFKEFQLELYEHNIFIKDNGEIEVVSCGDANYKEMQKRKEKLKNEEAIKKANIKKKIVQVKQIAYSRYLYVNRKMQLLAKNNIKKSYLPYSYFLAESSELKRLMFSLYE